MNRTFSAKQSLGQNFLLDVNMANKIVHCISPKEDDIILEIGPGYGVLTKLLQPKVKQLYAIEIDQRLYEFLDKEFHTCSNFYLFKEDFLKFDLNDMESAQKKRVVGNIPYNITSPILFKVFEKRQKISDLILLVQKEVGLRVISKPNTKDYGILAVLSQAVADVSLLLTVPASVFSPRPKVESALVRWCFSQERADKIVNELFFRHIVKQAFGLRRKMLRNSLKEYTHLTQFDFTKRPEQLSVNEWIALSNELYERQSL